MFCDFRHGFDCLRNGEGTLSPFIPGIKLSPAHPPCFIDISKMQCIFDMSLHRREGITLTLALSHQREREPDTPPCPASRDGFRLGGRGDGWRGRMLIGGGWVWVLHVLEGSAMEGPGLVRRKAPLEAASLRKPYTFWNEKGSVGAYPSTGSG